jgi:hypothetical protein
VRSPAARHKSRSQQRCTAPQHESGTMNIQTSILNDADREALNDDQLGAVAGGTTFRVDAETEPSHIIDPRTIDIPHKNLKGK